MIHKHTRMLIFLLIFRAVILFLACTPVAFASDLNSPPAAGLTKDKRSCIQTVDGYAYLSENMTLAQTRSAAFANAKRQAVETAKTHIASKTKVTDYKVDYDMIWADSEGSVTIIEQKDLGVEDNNRYHVWIKAEVEYELNPKKGLQDVKLDNKNAPLTVKVWTHQKKYKEGEQIEIFIKGNRDFYGKIVNITTDGNIIQLLPNDYRNVNFFQADKTYKIPDDEDQFSLKVSPPFGEDKIIAYVSEVPLGDTGMESIGRGLNQYKGSPEKFAALTRGITIEPDKKSPKAKTSVEFYETTWTFNTMK